MAPVTRSNIRRSADNASFKLKEVRVKLIRLNLKLPKTPILENLRTLSLRGRTIFVTISKDDIKKEELDKPARRTPPNRKKQLDDENLQVLFSVGQIVFAKVSGFAPWPARVVEIVKNTACTLKSKQKLTQKQKLKKSKYRVQFFKTEDTRLVTGDLLYFFTVENIRKFSEHRFRGAKLTKMFVDALQIATNSI